jgi:hypothetical protein
LIDIALRAMFIGNPNQSSASRSPADGVALCAAGRAAGADCTEPDKPLAQGRS